MKDRVSMSNTLANYLRFLCASVANIGQTGAVVPSQRFLIGKMISPVPVDYRGRIIELGAGSGVLTIHLAARCPHARILACEINPLLAKETQRQINLAGLAHRIEVVADSAEHVLSKVTANAEGGADYIFSGIPIGNLSRKRVLELVGLIHGALREKGQYIQFQYSLVDRKNIRSIFPSLKTSPVLLNFPPAVVYFGSKC